MADNFNIHEWKRNLLIESTMDDADLKAKKRVDIITSQILKQFPDLDKLSLRFAVSTALVDLSLEGLLESDDPKVGDELEAGVMGDSVEEGLTGSYKELEDSLKSKLEKIISKPVVKMGVYLANGQGFGSVDFIQKEDISAPTFEKLMAAIESEGYKVDPKQSRREYDFEDGERDFFPRIKFTWDPLDIDESVNENQNLTYNDFVRMTRDDMMAGAAPDEYPSDERVRKNAKSYYNQYLQGASLDDIFEATKEEETEFHTKLDKLVHDTFGKRKGELEESQLTKGINDKVSKELFKTLKGKTVRYKGARYKVVDADEYTLKLDPTEPGLQGITVNLNQFNKSGIIQEIIETISINKELEKAMQQVGQQLASAAKRAKPSKDDKPEEVQEGVVLTLGLIAGAPGLIEFLGKAVNFIGTIFGANSGTKVGNFLVKIGHKFEDFYIDSIGSWLLKAFPEKFKGQDPNDKSSTLHDYAHGIYLAMLSALAIGSGIEAAKAVKLALYATESGLAGLKSYEIIKLAEEIAKYGVKI